MISSHTINKDHSSGVAPSLLRFEISTFLLLLLLLPGSGMSGSQLLVPGSSAERVFREQRRRETMEPDHSL